MNPFCRFFDDKLTRNDAQSVCSNMRTFSIGNTGYLAELDNAGLRKDVQTYVSG